MERELYQMICQRLEEIPIVRNDRQIYDDRRIVQVHLWAALHDRPICWACQPGNWPLHLRRARIPSQSRMSRRLRTVSVQQLFQALYSALRAELPRSALKFIDGKPLPTGGCSKDADATFGHGAGTMLRGYRLVCIADESGPIDAWTLASMNVPEHRSAAHLLRSWSGEVTMVGDNAYDKNDLYELGEKCLHFFDIRRRSGMIRFELC